MKALTYIEHGKFALLDKPKPEILDRVIKVAIAPNDEPSEKQILCVRTRPLWSYGNAEPKWKEKYRFRKTVGRLEKNKNISG